MMLGLSNRKVVVASPHELVHKRAYQNQSVGVIK